MTELDKKFLIKSTKFKLKSVEKGLKKYEKLIHSLEEKIKRYEAEMECDNIFFEKKFKMKLEKIKDDFEKNKQQTEKHITFFSETYKELEKRKNIYLKILEDS